MFDVTEASDCTRRCPRHCDQLTITPRLAGSAFTPQNRSTRTARHPRLEVLISDELLVFGETQQYEFGKMVAEMLGNLSFLVGVSLVALYDWLIGLVLWMFGKLPFIPAMPPLIKNEIYMREACSCAETEEERRQSIREDTMDESATFLAASFRHHRRGSVLRSFNPHEDANVHRRRAMTINQLPMIALRSSAIDTLARTFPSEKSADRVRTSSPSVGRSRSSVREDGSGRALSEECSSTGRPPQEDSSAAPPAAEPPSAPEPPQEAKPAQEVPVEKAPSRTAAVSEEPPSRSALKRPSIRQVAPAEDGKALPDEKDRDEKLPSLAAAAPAGGGLPSIAAPRQAQPRGTVTFDLEGVANALGASSSSVEPPGEDSEPPERVQGPQRRYRPFRRRTQGSTAPGKPPR